MAGDPPVDAASDALIALGAVGAPHGLRGELRVRLYNPHSDLFAVLLAEGAEVVVRGTHGGRAPERKRLTSVRPSGVDFALVGLAGVNDRDAAIALRGTELCVPRSALPPLGDDEIYVADLIGLRVGLPDGRELGTVKDVIDYPASQVLVVTTPTGELEVPLCEPYLVETRVADGLVIVDAIDDLEPVPGRGR